MRRPVASAAALVLLFGACGGGEAPGGVSEGTPERGPAAGECDPAIDSSMAVVVPEARSDSMPVARPEPSIPIPNPCAGEGGPSL